MTIPDEQIGKLTVRLLPEGGGLSNAVKVEKKPVIDKSDIIILIHGYNVNQAEGEAAYQSFVDLFGGYFLNSCPYNIFHFYWSGDVKNKVLSAASYPWEIPVAINAASLLHNYLQTLPTIGGRPLRICFVAHSLGNRLVLEEIAKQLQNRFKHRIVFYTGMASAVPVYMVEEDGELIDAALLPDKTLVLYSTSDIILHLAFPTGQTLAGEGFLPQAVGRKGNPEKYIWKMKAEMKGYSHGDYWTGTESIGAVGKSLGIPLPNSIPLNGIPKRLLPDDYSTPSTSISSRTLPVRNLTSA